MRVRKGLGIGVGIRVGFGFWFLEGALFDRAFGLRADWATSCRRRRAPLLGVGVVLLVVSSPGVAAGRGPRADRLLRSAGRMGREARR